MGDCYATTCDMIWYEVIKNKLGYVCKLDQRTKSGETIKMFVQCLFIDCWKIECFILVSTNVSGGFFHIYFPISNMLFSQKESYTFFSCHFSRLQKRSGHKILSFEISSHHCWCVYILIFPIDCCIPVMCFWFIVAAGIQLPADKLSIHTIYSGEWWYHKIGWRPKLCWRKQENTLV